MKAIYSSLILLLCATAALPLTSCRIVGNKPDFGGVKDAFTPARDDEVYVESSGGASRPVAAASAPSAASHAAPAAHATAHASHGAGTYVVRHGDTLSGIARAHHVGLSALASANGMTPQNALIKPGQTLRIPRSASATSSGASKTATHAAPARTGGAHAASRYTVRKGDTMASIAHKHGVTLQALLKANELTVHSARFVQPGAVITIPAHR